MIPLGWFASILGHGIESWVSGRELPVSLLSVWGMVALSGVIINDAVVFLAKFNSLIKNDGYYLELYGSILSSCRDGLHSTCELGVLLSCGPVVNTRYHLCLGTENW